MADQIHIQVLKGNTLYSEVYAAVTRSVYGTSGSQATVPAEHLLEHVVALKNELPIGMLSIYLNNNISYESTIPILFGNYECINELEVSKALFQYVVSKAEQLNRKLIIGPVSGSTWQTYRTPLTGSAQQFSGDLTYPLYYKEHLLHSGFQIAEQYVSSTSPAQHANQVNNLPAEIKIRSINLNKYEEELEHIYQVCGAAFKGNILYSPISKHDFIELYKPYMHMINERYVLVAERDDKIIAFLFAYPDTEHNSLVVKTLARHPEYKTKGLVQQLINTVYQHAAEDDLQRIIHAFMHVDNKSFILSQARGSSIIREYAVFKKEVS